MNLVLSTAFLILLVISSRQVGSVYLNNHVFNCLDNSTKIPIGQMCDDVIDCPDLSDECLCSKTSNHLDICSRIEWQNGENGNTEYFSCQTSNSSDIKMPTMSICDGVDDCRDDIDEKYCVQDECSGVSARKIEQPDAECGFTCNNGDKQATRCDGIISCENIKEEECDGCPDKPAFCQNLNENNFYVCKNGSLINTIQVCNGINDCNQGEEEINCPRRFYCANGSPVHIPENRVCDKHKDCVDASDERNCSLTSHFYCGENTDDVKFVESGQVCDGSDDCEDASDECRHCILNSAFSDIASLIKNKLAEAVTWISSILALFGNLVVAVLCIRYIACEKNRTSDEMINKSLIFSLSLSDLLVGIYALSVSIQHTLSKGDYCRLAQEWRSSVTCSALGTILLLGLENLILTLLIMSSYKLMKVTSPTANTSLKLIWILISISWLVSILLAVIPLFPAADNFFVTSIWYKDNPLFGMIYRDQVDVLNTRLQSMLNITSAVKRNSWSSLTNSIQLLNPEYKIGRSFGFYSTSGVCFPALFPDPRKITAWPYALFLIIFNVLAIVFIFAWCVVIYRKSTAQGSKVDDTLPRNPATVKNKANDNTEIIRISAAAFLCWIPICLLAILQMAGVQIHNDAYFVVGLLLTPIHSALKPFLYSDVQDFMKALKEQIMSWLGFKTEKPKDEIELSNLEEAQPAISPVED